MIIAALSKISQLSLAMTRIHKMHDTLATINNYFANIFLLVVLGESIPSQCIIVLKHQSHIMNKIIVSCSYNLDFSFLSSLCQALGNDIKSAQVSNQ